MTPRVVAIWVAIRIAIIASVIRPVVGAVVPPTVITTIRITIVAAISVAAISIPIAIATISVAGISPIAITTPLRHIAIYATLRICRWSERRRYGEREDAHQRQRNDYFLKSSVVHTPPFRAFRRLSWTINYRAEPRVLYFSIARLVPASPSLGAFKSVCECVDEDLKLL
jgi:hypothetical protein